MYFYLMFLWFFRMILSYSNFRKNWFIYQCEMSTFCGRWVSSDEQCVWAKCQHYFFRYVLLYTVWLFLALFILPMLNHLLQYSFPFGIEFKLAIHKENPDSNHRKWIIFNRKQFLAILIEHIWFFGNCGFSLKIEIRIKYSLTRQSGLKGETEQKL